MSARQLAAPVPPADGEEYIALVERRDETPRVMPLWEHLDARIAADKCPTAVMGTPETWQEVYAALDALAAEYADDPESYPGVRPEVGDLLIGLDEARHRAENARLDANLCASLEYEADSAAAFADSLRERLESLGAHRLRLVHVGQYREAS